MSDLQLAGWDKTRRTGKRRFVWLTGVLGWGVPTGIMVALMQRWMKPDVRPSSSDVVITLIIYLIGGYFWGWSMWVLAERRYTRTVESRDAAATPNE